MTPTDESLEDLLKRAADDPSSVTEADVSRILDSVDKNRTESVDAVASVVETDPALADPLVEYLAPLLSDPDERTRRNATFLLTELAPLAPERLTPVVPELIERLEDELFIVRSNALGTLLHIARYSSSAVVEAIPRLPPLLDTGELRLMAVEIVALVAESSPSDVAPFTSTLVEVAADRYTSIAEDTDRWRRVNEHEDQYELIEIDNRSSRRYTTVRTLAVHSILKVAEHNPDALLNESDQIIDLVETEDDPVIKGDLIRIIKLLAREGPAEVVDAVRPLTAMLTGTPAIEEERKAEVMAALAAIADGEEAAVADAVEPAIPDVIDALDAEGASTRAAAASLLMYVCAHHGEAVEPAVPRLIALLDDDHEPVRGSAAWVLGHVGGADARDRLETTRNSDSSHDVRITASQAIDHIERRLDE